MSKGIASVFRNEIWRLKAAGAQNPGVDGVLYLIDGVRHLFYLGVRVSLTRSQLIEQSGRA